MTSTDTYTPNIHPVIIGGDIGVYALARSFHESYGITSTILCESITQAIDNSSICSPQVVSIKRNGANLIKALKETATSIHNNTPQAQLICLTNSDFYVSLITQHKSTIEELGYFIPFPSYETFQRVSDKQEFALLAHDVQMKTPQTQSVDFSHSTNDTWKIPEPHITFPLIGKPALSSYWAQIHFEGKEKISHITTYEEYIHLMNTLREAGFCGEYLLQELIPGDDTTQRSVTAYVNQHGKVTLLASAHVLLEDHTAAAAGIPNAMISTRDDALLAPVQAFLESIDYHGFANFDAKVDPRTNEVVFFEVNPRIGRNNYYVHASGASPAQAIANDIKDVDTPVAYGQEEALYSTVPSRLLQKYLTPTEKTKVRHLIKQKKYNHPLVYSTEQSLKRKIYILLSYAKHIYKYRKAYPKRTESGF
ncbi:MAG: hypothetical protein J6M18_06135 [Actinomycetaceae bacterium]|nr:hypothetical protein [Actinomycetaceae bacterium]